MKAMLLAAAAIGGAILVAQAQSARAPAIAPGPTAPERLSWAGFERAFGAAGARPRPAIAPAAAPADQAAARPAEQVAAPDLDVVDAHWMALTMWGEARSDGEEGMRAVGHVIDNRRRAGAANPRFVTETVNEAWQFSCWNRSDPNYAAMLNIDSLPPESRDYRLWRRARALADEIMAGRSSDPTGGALFYHTTAVAPHWSEGVAPVRRIGAHLFFRTANGT